MAQEGQAGRDLTQIGGNLHKKLVEIIVSREYSPEVHIHSQENSWLSVCMSQWDQLNEEQRISLAISSIKDIRTLPDPPGSTSNLFLVVLLLLLAIPHALYRHPATAELMNRGEYIVYTTFCAIKDPQSNFVVCPPNGMNEKTSSGQSQNTYSESEHVAKKAFETYKQTWFRQLMVWVIVPIFLASVLEAVIGFPLRVIFASSRDRYEQTRQARIQTAR